MFILDALGRGLGESFFMFWATLWALVLGFGLSGAVQSFVSRAEMQQALGDHRPRTLVKASFFGMVSSSCSYAASALAKSLFARGADFTSAIIFMIASTNLVVELGIVLWLLIGWQFALAEFVGGAIMIVLLALVLPRAVPAGWLEPVRRQLAGPGGAGEQPTVKPWRQRIRSRAGWADSATYTISDLTMLRRELLAGFLIAGFLAELVPNSFWRSLFVTGHGFLSSLENVVLGPFLALISFVCSIGNVPLAAALWKGGISFGGVIAFVFADLITLPLLLIYRKYYGVKITLRLLGVFWVVMSLGGLATEYLFKALGVVPATHPTTVVPIGFHFDYTSILDVIALVAFAALYWLYRNRERFGGGSGYAKDVVCGMQVETAHAPASAHFDGQMFYFCSDRCEERFSAEPAKFAHAPAPAALSEEGAGELDPVCGMTVEAAASESEEFAGRRYHFCGPGCRQAFHADPLGHLATARDPVCGMDVDVSAPGGRARAGDREYVFCGPGCVAGFQAEPARYLDTPAEAGQP